MRQFPRQLSCTNRGLIGNGMMRGLKVRECNLVDARLFSASRAEHIMAMPAAQRRWRAGEVRQLIAESPLSTPRYELVDGELLVTPSPNEPHQRAVFRLARALDEYLERNTVGQVYTSPFDVELEPDTIVQPDVFILPMHEVERVRIEMPARELLVAAEVLSPSSSRGDRVAKRPLYGRYVSEYWIVDLDARIVERWPLHARQPEIIVSVLEWQPTGTAERFRLDLAKYFAAVFGERRV
jgi:Uma2 family endonuclease